MRGWTFLRVLALILAITACASDPTRSGAAEPTGLRRQKLSLPSVSAEIVLGDPSSISDQAPAAAWGSDEYLVVWSEQATSGSSIHAQRLAPDGAVVDRQPFTVSASPSSASSGLVLASDGTSFLLFGGGGQRIFADATVEQTPLSEPVGDVAWDGATHFGVWGHSTTPGEDCFLDQAIAQRFAPDGRSIGGSILVFDEKPCGMYMLTTVPSVAFSGRVHLVPFFSYGVVAVRVTAAGKVLDADPLVIARSGAGTPSYWPTDVAWGDEQFVVVYQSSQRASDGSGLVDEKLLASRIDVDGNLLAPAGAPFSDAGAVAGPLVVHDGSSFVAVWSERRGASADVMAARIDAVGQVLDPGGFVVSDAPENEHVRAAASDGAGRILVVYERARSAGDALWVRARLIGPPNTDAGVVVEPEPDSGDALPEAAMPEAALPKAAPPVDGVGEVGGCACEQRARVRGSHVGFGLWSVLALALMELGRARSRRPRWSAGSSS
jgi:hypothetical protein